MRLDEGAPSAASRMQVTRDFGFLFEESVAVGSKTGSNRNTSKRVRVGVEEGGAGEDLNFLVVGRAYRNIVNIEAI